MYKFLLLILLLFTPISTFCPYKFHLIPTKTAVIIATQEGFYHAGTLPNRYHNPGSLVYNHQRNAHKGGYHQFAIFDTDEDGLRALLLNISYLRRNHRQLNSVWTYLQIENFDLTSY